MTRGQDQTRDEVEPVMGEAGPLTRVHVRLAPVRSLFPVSSDRGNRPKPLYRYLTVGFVGCTFPCG